MRHNVSVIVVTYNSAAVLPGCLEAISAHLQPSEIVVVDNGSGDDSVMIATAHAHVKVVQGHGNVGYGSGVNLGAEVAAGPILLVMNPDATLVGVDGAQLDSLAGSRSVGIRSCRRVGAGRAQHAVYPAWRWRTELHWWMFAWFLLPNELPMPRPRPRGRQPRWVNAAAFVVRRQEFLSLGGFDEDFFLYFEDFDLCRSYRRRGWPVGTTDALLVRHAHAQSSPRDEERMIAYALLGLIQYVAKSDRAEAERAAGYSLRLLRAISRSGQAVRSVPLVGPRAAKKQVFADSVRLRLDEIVAGEGPAGKYRAAREAMSVATRAAAHMRCGRPR
jgi:N-acetylglucosaminyl-diphospho-decaprenol L-rhamnosyltransferase